MDVHQNARSCARSRALLARRVRDEGWSVAAAAEAAGMSARRSREWVRRSDRGESLEDRSSRPLRCRSITSEQRESIFQLRRERFHDGPHRGDCGCQRLDGIESVPGQS